MPRGPVRSARSWRATRGARRRRSGLPRRPAASRSSDSHSAARWSFSAARAGLEVLVAVGRSGPVGVDIEAVRDHDDLEQAVDAVLASEERDLADASAPARRPVARYRAWARKEAFLKAIGIGFAVDPRRIAILPTPGARPSACLDVRVDGRIIDWRVIDLDAGPAHVAALCGPGDERWPVPGAG